MLRRTINMSIDDHWEWLALHLICLPPCLAKNVSRSVWERHRIGAGGSRELSTKEKKRSHRFNELSANRLVRGTEWWSRAGKCESARFQGKFHQGICRVEEEGRTDIKDHSTAVQSVVSHNTKGGKFCKTAHSPVDRVLITWNRLDRENLARRFH